MERQACSRHPHPGGTWLNPYEETIMTHAQLTGMVQTVLGPVVPEELGITLTHEHLLSDISCTFREPTDPDEQRMALEPVSLENLWWVRYHWASNLDNRKLSDEATAIAEALHYKQMGGQTIVDASNIGLARNPTGLARIARATGLHIVMGTGYYIAASHPADMDQRSEDHITEEIIREVTEGVDQTDIRAGLIGEIGCSWPWQENEKKVMRAAAQAQRNTGAPLMIHPGRDEAAPLDIVRALEDAGADLQHTIMAHIERTMFDMELILELASTGVYLEYDLFGHESSFYPLAAIDMPNDAQRLAQLQELVVKGCLRQILMAHDICTKTRLTRYGGHGYAHILRNVVPRMRQKGFLDDHIQTILVENPRRVLTFQ
jgi:phosphotriesterase-related protein